ncbi:MAG: response regulator [Alphaproteobacteria bacterium]|nr:response regulator [Alphaproteobacteria bacterium]
MANILLAEDDESMLNFLMIALQRAGHSVVARSNGADALSALEEKEGSDTPFDLLLTDIVMPEIDGLELAHKTTEKYPDMKVMFITGFAAMALEDHKRYDSNSTRTRPQILSKPFHLNDLVERIEDLLSTTE